jgi:hypothetical protein
MSAESQPHQQGKDTDDDDCQQKEIKTYSHIFMEEIIEELGGVKRGVMGELWGRM